MARRKMAHRYAQWNSSRFVIYSMHRCPMFSVSAKPSHHSSCVWSFSFWTFPFSTPICIPSCFISACIIASRSSCSHYSIHRASRVWLSSAPPLHLATLPSRLRHLCALACNGARMLMACRTSRVAAPPVMLLSPGSSCWFVRPFASCPHHTIQPSPHTPRTGLPPCHALVACPRRPRKRGATSHTLGGEYMHN
jgi:hypothetical protein